MEYKNLIYAAEGTTAIITIDRPNVLNALSHDTLRELDDCISQIEQDDAIRVFIITGAGVKSFVAGADIHELDHISAYDGYTFMELGQRVFDRIELCRKPSIAAVNGYALGGGNELCMCCDFRIASENAKFGQPEIKLGNIPGWGGTQRLPRLIGRGRASQMIFTGEFIRAEQAKEWGLVNEVVSQEMLLPRAKEIAAVIADRGPIALHMAKEAIRRGLDSEIHTGQSVEAHGVSMCLTTDDQKEGVSAFLEKRKAIFRGK